MYSEDPGGVARAPADWRCEGEQGAFDLDFDEVCTAYAVTMISGPDFLRQLAPDGTLTECTRSP